ncbi:MAG: glycosyltransferase family 4 protein [Clostridiales bacterium]|nr:glycosyltransferase family 4 protein [Clostridiales bacterium]
MVIGQFCETYPPARDGVGRVMLAYCQTLDQMGHECFYIAPQDSARSETDGCSTLLYPGIGIPGEPYRVGFPEMSRTFTKQIYHKNFDIVHVHSPFLAARTARRIARKQNIPLVATFHSKYYDDFYRATHSKTLSNLGIRYILSLYRSCDEVWAVNEKTAQVLRGYGYDGEIVIMPNGTNVRDVSAAEYEASLSPYPLKNDLPTLIFVGQMDIKKNTESIIRACALLKEQGVQFQMLMVGDGQDVQFLKKLSKELGIHEQILFTGFISDHAAMLSLYKRSDLLVFPSIYDNAPMVVREAASMGTPALLVENTCSAEGVIDGENGFLCQNSVQSIADGIQNALSHTAQVGANAKLTIPIPWEKLMADVLSRYEQLIAKRK